MGKKTATTLCADEFAASFPDVLLDDFPYKSIMHLGD